jgi:hypothetical protein
LVLEEFHKNVVAKIVPQTFFGECLPAAGGVVKASNPSLVRVHKGDEGSEHGANIPARTPGLFMVVGECSANGFAYLKASALGQQPNFGRRKRVVFGELHHPMVVTSFEIFFQIKQAEMERKSISPGDQGLRQRLFLKRLNLLLYPQKGYFFIHRSLQ